MGRHSAPSEDYELSTKVPRSNTVDTSSSDSNGSRGHRSSDILKYPSPESNDLELEGKLQPVVATYENVALNALHVDDDPTLNPWTFRMFFLG